MKIESFRRRFFDLLPRYEWTGTVGHGGIGVVFKAFDRELEETVALKVLTPNLGRDENALLARFKREVALNRRIKHPNVARMYDYGIAGDYPYISMELIDGDDLWTLIGRRHRYPAAEAVPIVRQIARGTAAIHRLGILHRDLKSQNVIVDRRGAAVILDFGLARGSREPGLTMASVLLGTPQYMAPEQALGGALDERADLYSIGVIAWEMLAGRTPFHCESPVATAMLHVHEPLPDIRELVPGLPPDLFAVLGRVLAKKREERFASALELDDALALCDTGPAAPLAEARLLPEAEAFLREVEIALDSIILPRDSRSAPRSEAPKTLVTPRPRRRPPVVLVVEEDVRNLLKLATALCATGCRTLEVTRAEEALETALSRQVDLVLMDTRLSGMDGFDVARILKSIPRAAHIPVLLLAPAPDRALHAFALQSGAVDLLPKPVPQALLEERIWELLGRRRLRPPLRAASAPRGRRHPRPAPRDAAPREVEEPALTAAARIIRRRPEDTMTDVPRILAFAGSLRAGSYNKKILAVAADGARAAGADVTRIDLRDFPLPVYDADLETAEGLPANAVKLKELFKAADGLLVASPEYNSADQRHPQERLRLGLALRRRARGRWSASRGRSPRSAPPPPAPSAGSGASRSVRLILGNIGVVVLPDQVALPKAADAFDSDGNVVDPGRRKALMELGGALAHATRALMTRRS